MVFKFERKSTEKKCEKRKKWCLLWKKFCNNRNLSECMCKLRQMLTFFFCTFALKFKAAGNKEKIIEEFVGAVNTGDADISIARMTGMA